MSSMKNVLESKPTPKDFGFEVPQVDREHGHVYIQYGGKIYKWFLREDTKEPLLINEDERALTQEVIHAMKSQVCAILRPELAKRD